MMRFLRRIDNFMENSKAAEQDEKKKTSKNIHGCSEQGHGVGWCQEKDLSQMKTDGALC